MSINLDFNVDKKKLITITIIIIAIIGIIFIINNKNSAVKTINKHSNIPINLLTKYNADSAILKRYEKNNNDLFKGLYSDDISMYYYHYKNDNDKYYLANISLTSKKYDILGISVGTFIEDAKSILKKYHFKLTNDDYFELTFTNKNVEIILYNDPDDTNELIINQIRVRVIDKNLDNIA